MSSLTLFSNGEVSLSTVPRLQSVCAFQVCKCCPYIRHVSLCWLLALSERIALPTRKHDKEQRCYWDVILEPDSSQPETSKLASHCRGHFSERDAAVIIKVILEVVGFCHESGVIHRDLKPENFLLKRQALDPKLPLRPEDVRAVDFGLAFFLEPNQNLRELLGSPFYVAPELLRVSSP